MYILFIMSFLMKKSNKNFWEIWFKDDHIAEIRRRRKTAMKIEEFSCSSLHHS